ncbi:GNAT family N-acetyltransferase [Nibribacter ruber]|uniref:GNAT family N-acetyltransferase n=1 Tax=Nibribacter ruber TaxID=2698458 RepID=A0A6P1P340_9BACT|nr:GNAT family protein [Nibribacter ruber]QHL88793.1 GNAT family N-acetyltransferase [Nibribacter ruber]
MRQHITSYVSSFHLTTARLLLRPYHLEEAQVFWNLLEANKARLLSDFPDRTSSVTNLEEAVSRIKMLEYQRRTGDLYSFGIWRQQDRQYIGDITLRRLARGKKVAEVGYYIDIDAEGQGYISEAMHALLEYAFEVLHLEAVNLRCAKENQRSQKVAERNGFTKTGEFVPYLSTLSDAPARPLFTYKITRKEFPGHSR